MLPFSHKNGDPEGLKKVREAFGMQFHLNSCKLDFMVPSYDEQKPKSSRLRKQRLQIPMNFQENHRNS